MTKPTGKIGLALSGGGIRASAFHAGVLLYCAENDLMETVAHISSVSGGTLFTGLLFHSASLHWPSSFAYRNTVYGAIRSTLTTKSLQRDFILSSFSPKNWDRMLTRPNILADSIKKVWNITNSMGDLPQTPVWTVNGTTTETGRRFRVRGCRLGDFELGNADATHFDLAAAMAISVAFPVGTGPLLIDAQKYIWYRPSPENPAADHTANPLFERILVYDGGLYDNLAIEPLFDVGRQAIKQTADVDRVILSDAGSPYARQPLPNRLSPARIKRLVDSTTDQTRALRVRAFINFLRHNPDKGLYCQLGMNFAELLENHAEIPAKHADAAREMEWQSLQRAKKARVYPIGLGQMDPEDFDIIARNGYESAKASHLLFGQDD